MPLGKPFEFPFEADPRSSPAAAIEADLFGEDLLFNDDLVVTPAGDWTVIGGLPNLRQAIYHRLLTKPGEFRLRPEYGVGVARYVKKTMTKAKLDQLRQDIIQNLAQEKRIEKVVEVNLTPTTYGHDTALRIQLKIQAIGRTRTMRPFTFTQEQ